VRRGSVRRFIFLAGVTVLLLGVFALIGSIETDDDYNCGTAIAPRRILIPERAEECRQTIRVARLRGAIILAVAVPAVVLTGPRSLLAPD
jgi:hypothetical protein